jgi:hypothetical protein
MPPPTSCKTQIRPATVYVATSFACSRETRELGEDYAELKKIERAYRLLEHRLVSAQPRLQAERALSTVLDFSLTLADARHDASWGTTLSAAREAFVEARVTRMARPSVRQSG